MRSPKSCNRLVDFAGCLIGCDADAPFRRKLLYEVQWALAFVVAVAFTAPGTAQPATYLLQSPPSRIASCTAFTKLSAGTV
jgi:hypothetical protein